MVQVLHVQAAWDKTSGAQFVPRAQLLAEALMAVLPGIDANDEQKTMAVMQLYTTVLSCLPVLHQAGDEVATAAGGVWQQSFRVCGRASMSRMTRAAQACQ